MLGRIRRLFGMAASGVPAPAAGATEQGNGAAGEQTGEYSPPPPNPPASRLPLQVGLATHVGQVRDHNEDALFAMTSLQSSDAGDVPFGLFIIADGMGGHQGGEEASALASRTVARYVTQEVYLPFLSGGGPDADRKPWQEALTEAITAANQAVRAAIPDGGTTLTTALIVGDQLTIAHVGDSRAYLVGDDGLKRLTRDHSLVQRLQELGQLSAEEAAVHPSRNMLYRAVGQADLLEADVSAHTLAAPAMLLLCSDGLWGVVPAGEIHMIIRQAIDEWRGSPGALQIACQRLIEAANRRGGPDNITAILVEVNAP